MRKMATVRRIVEIKVIPNADKICAYRVDGWWVVDSVGNYSVDDLVVYVETDSWVPTALAPFLSKGKEPRVYEGVSGEQLRTVRLRKQISQGLLLPYAVCGKICAEGDDVSELLGIVKYEPPVNSQLAGMIKGLFPDKIPKTDQARVQNLTEEIQSAVGMQFELTEKLEGASMTCYMIDGEFGVCTRNLDLKPDANNTPWAVAQRNDVEGKMRAVDKYWSWAIQGELIGPGIQENIYKLQKPQFCVFDVYDIQTGKYLPPAARRALIERMGLTHVPVIDEDWVLAPGVQTQLETAKGKSQLNPLQEREGIVFKSVKGGMTFKAISNSYLLGEKS
jgi:RNA ligase (TIGR02306 family)